MSFFSEIFGKVKKGAEVASTKANDITQITKASIDIVSTESRIEDKYLQIGKLVYATKTTEISNDEEIDAQIEQINQLLKECDEKREIINDIKKVKICGKCSAQNNCENDFCGKCGETL